LAARAVGAAGAVFSDTITIVVGALGTVTKGLEKNLKKAGSNVAVELLQKCTPRNITNIEKGTRF